MCSCFTFTAVENDNLEIVKLLLGAGADPNIVAFKSTSALHSAAEVVSEWGGWGGLPHICFVLNQRIFLVSIYRFKVYKAPSLVNHYLFLVVDLQTRKLTMVILLKRKTLGKKGQFNLRGNFYCLVQATEKKVIKLCKITMMTLMIFWWTRTQTEDLSPY